MNKKRINMEDYYSGLYNMPLPVFSKHLERNTKCRVCLQSGDMPIASVRNRSEMKEALNIFGNIPVDDDEDRTCLCYVCYKFLKSAILFRKVAQRTNETLNQLIMKQSPDHYDDYDYLAPYEDVKSNQIIYSTKDPVIKKEPERFGKKVKCPICKKLLHKTYYYQVHLHLHNPNFPDQYVCDICGKSFKFKKVYRGHMERHETRYLFKCDLCPFAGRYKERLTTHMRVHTGELKYLCTHCPARYLSRNRLNDHIKFKHTDPQYKCDSCDKAYHSNLFLQRHIEAAHLQMKKHQCDMCGKAFGYRKDLLKHTKTVHKRANMRTRFVKTLQKH